MGEPFSWLFNTAISSASPATSVVSSTVYSRPPNVRTSVAGVAPKSYLAGGAEPVRRAGEPGLPPAGGRIAEMTYSPSRSPVSSISSPGASSSESSSSDDIVLPLNVTGCSASTRTIMPVSHDDGTGSDPVIELPANVNLVGHG